MKEEIRNETIIINLIDRSVLVMRYLISKWLVIFSITFIFGLLGILYAWMHKTRYIAEMSFVTESESKGAISTYAGIAAQFGIDIGGVGTSSLFEGENLIELLKSKNLVIQTLLTPYGSDPKNLMINEYLKVNDIARNSESINYSEYGLSENRKRDSILLIAADGIIKNDLEINRRDKKLSIIDLKMSSVNELFAKRFVERLANSAIQYYTDYKIKKSKQNVAILERQTDSIRTMLYGGIGDVASITDLNVNPIKQAARTGSQKKQIEVQANGALYVELLKNLELSKLALRRETPLIQIVDMPVLPLVKKGIGRFRTGIIFGFIGGFLGICFLLIRKWLRDMRSVQHKV
jgi:hypothetical protein